MEKYKNTIEATDNPKIDLLENMDFHQRLQWIYADYGNTSDIWIQMNIICMDMMLDHVLVDPNNG